MIYLLELSDTQLSKVIDLVHLHTGITIAPSKKNMVQGRIRRRLKDLGLEDYDDYLLHLETNENEKQEFINIITTNETSFFRTKKVWDYFQLEYLKNWNSSGPLKIWSAAASTGEESYSIAMSCEERKKIGINLNYEIIGTDISTKALSIGEGAEYSGRNFKNMKEKFPELVVKYFNITGDKGEIKPYLRKNIKYFSYNLFEPPKSPLDNFDIVFLRNVLIYFKKEDQKKVIANVAKTMKEGGVLILGESESINGLSNEFKFISPQIYMKK
ncbi:CheR family methyltransferase [Halobacteriovorax sp. DPLXC-1]|uniref:CheR family methyltransferase n=1 Tax=Halobacteriovorax sp. DPLXC-1 TaxID=3110771 RepID=UPI002FF004E4